LARCGYAATIANFEPNGSIETFNNGIHTALWQTGSPFYSPTGRYSSHISLLLSSHRLLGYFRYQHFWSSTTQLFEPARVLRPSFLKSLRELCDTSPQSQKHPASFTFNEWRQWSRSASRCPGILIKVPSFICGYWGAILYH